MSGGGLSDGLESLAAWPGTHRAAGWRSTSRPGGDRRRHDRPFPLASVTKLLTATAVLVAVQEEIVDLDEPAGPPGSTVRLLLCHASGLPFEGSRAGRRAGPTAHLRQPRLRGARRSSSPTRSDVPFADYVREAVLEPLGMVATTITGSPAHGARVHAR